VSLLIKKNINILKIKTLNFFLKKRNWKMKGMAVRHPQRWPGVARGHPHWPRPLLCFSQNLFFKKIYNF